MKKNKIKLIVNAIDGRLSDVGKIATCNRCFKQKEIEMQSTVHGKNNFEWTERLCGECSDKQYRRSCELCDQILATWHYRKDLTNNHSKEDIAKTLEKI